MELSEAKARRQTFNSWKECLILSAVFIILATVFAFSLGAFGEPPATRYVNKEPAVKVISHVSRHARYLLEVDEEDNQHGPLAKEPEGELEETAEASVLSDGTDEPSEETNQPSEEPNEPSEESSKPSNEALIIDSTITEKRYTSLRNNKPLYLFSTIRVVVTAYSCVRCCTVVTAPASLMIVNVP
jgi:hypothetical protein